MREAGYAVATMLPDWLRSVIELLTPVGTVIGLGMGFFLRNAVDNAKLKTLIVSYETLEKTVRTQQTQMTTMREQISQLQKTQDQQYTDMRDNLRNVARIQGKLDMA
jgi:hypothetical protein